MPPPPWTLFPMVFHDQYVEGVEKKNSPRKSGPYALFRRFFEFQGLKGLKKIEIPKYWFQRKTFVLKKLRFDEL